ncbi:MAG: YqbH/XkdH family protein [Clostridiales bacterium]|nr:YqbH/XkdH family protein [Clostridiales bacterium]
MSLEALLNHTCDIYHLVETSESPGYNLPESPAFAYPESPDVAGQTCHFAVKSATTTVTQSEPANLLDAKIKLTLPLGTDIRVNDKVIDCDTGLEYTAENPVTVRNHHMFAYVKRIDRQKEL